jgi:hypothetical protein
MGQAKRNQQYKSKRRRFLQLLALISKMDHKQAQRYADIRGIK